MPQICHLHCPSPAGTSAGIIIAVAAGVSATAAISAYIGDIVLTAGIIVVVLLVASTWCLVHVLRRDQRHVTSRETVDQLTERLRAPVAAPARKALPASRKAISGAYVITDAAEAPEPARIAIKRDGTVTG